MMEVYNESVFLCSGRIKMDLKRIVKRTLFYTIKRNDKGITGSQSANKRVNLEYWDKRINIGDTLSPLIVEWMLEQKNKSLSTPIKSKKHLFAVGSVLGMGNCDGTVWGSGIHTERAAEAVKKQSYYRKYDIRHVRGPRTRKILLEAGYEVPEIYGDPAILMPMIYSPSNINKEYEVSIIQHISNQNNEGNAYHTINVATDDYKYFIDEICKSKLVITSSLHGLILSEVYGIPTVFLNQNMDGELLKFYDWYESTGRCDVKMAKSIEEALRIQPMDVPYIKEMQNKVYNVFPYDMWE